MSENDCMMDTNWTIAYRKPRANVFRRVTNWRGSWDDAKKMADVFCAAHPGMQVFYVTTRAAELTEYVSREDIGNIMLDNGKRVPITDTGTLTLHDVFSQGGDDFGIWS